MNVLIVHQNFPGQFPHIADALVKRGDRVAAIGSNTAKGRPGVDLRRWTLKRGSTKGIFVAATRAEADLMRAQAAAQVMRQLAADGFTPDVVIGHSGWGETIHVKEVWPETRLIVLGEMFYRTRGNDSNFDSEFAPELGASPFEDALRVNAKGATCALACVLADRIVCPTPFQASTFPASLQPSITILHEGVDLTRASPQRAEPIQAPDGHIVQPGQPLITFVNRVMEPMRGFHIFMRALPAFLDACPSAHVCIVGQDKPHGYGAAAPGGKGWTRWMLAELGDRLDRSRVHFMGGMPHDILIKLLSMSWAHVYYTYPFVLSWSLVEAMACECLIIASDTPPVRDAVTDGENGVLLPFFDVGALSTAMIRAVNEPQAFLDMRRMARASATFRFAKETGVTGWLKLLDQQAG